MLKFRWWAKCRNCWLQRLSFNWWQRWYGHNI